MAPTMMIATIFLFYSLNVFAHGSHNLSELPTPQVLLSPLPFEFPSLESTQHFPMQSCQGLTIEEATVDQLQEAMASGTLNAVELFQCYLQRIYQTDSYLGYVDHASISVQSSFLSFPYGQLRVYIKGHNGDKP